MPLKRIGGIIGAAATNKIASKVQGDEIGGLAFGILNDFLAGYRDDSGFARPSRFEVLVLPPSKLKIGSSSNGKTKLEDAFTDIFNQMTTPPMMKNISMKCKSITMPGRNLDTEPDTNLYGPPRQNVSGFSFAEINASFYLSNDLQERRYFEGWQELSFNRSSWDMGYYNDYVGSLEIYQLDLEDRRRMGVKLFDVFPKTISGMSYDYGTTNQISTVDIGFSYRYWETLGTSDPKKGFSERVNDRVRDVIERKILSQVPKVISKL